jgi:hypothetical protein
VFFSVNIPPFFIGFQVHLQIIFIQKREEEEKEEKETGRRRRNGGEKGGRRKEGFIPGCLTWFFSYRVLTQCFSGNSF